MVVTRSGRICGGVNATNGPLVGAGDEGARLKMEEDLAYQRRVDAEGLHFQRIFPEEIWLLIINNLDKAKDVIAVSNSSPYFRQLLRTKLNLVQFPKVLEHLASNVYQYRKYSNEPEVDTAMLKMRTVCKTWRDTIDKFQVEASQQSPIRPVADSYNFTVDAIERLSKAERFTQHFGATHQQQNSNPFISREVTVFSRFNNFDNGRRVVNEQVIAENEERSFAALRNLLATYGSHVWCLRLIRKLRMVPFQAYLKMQQLLNSTPNLKFLHIDLEFQDLTAEQLEMVVLPRLANLQQVVVDLPLPILNVLFQANNHITRLTLLEARAEWPLANLRNLQVLGIGVCEEKDFLRLEEEMYNQITWPLKSLFIRFPRSGLQEPERVFGMISRKWGNTLKELHLLFFHPDQDPHHFVPKNPIPYPNLKLPHLERFHMAFNTYSGLDFILPMKGTLKYLRLQYATDKKQVYKARFAGYARLNKWLKALRNPLEEDLIWKEFPNLSVLLIWDEGKVAHRSKNKKGDKMDRYTRTDWEKNEKKKKRSGDQPENEV